MNNNKVDFTMVYNPNLDKLFIHGLSSKKYYDLKYIWFVFEKYISLRKH